MHLCSSVILACNFFVHVIALSSFVIRVIVVSKMSSEVFLPLTCINIEEVCKVKLASQGQILHKYYTILYKGQIVYNSII